MTGRQRTHVIERIGYLTPLIALLGILFSVALAPHFSWVDNALSDLGHWTRIDVGPHPFARALIFNSSLTTTGILLTIITFLLMKEVRDRSTVIALFPFLLTAGFLTSIGVFSEDTWLRIGDTSLHYISSLGFFITFPFAMWFTGLSWLRFQHLRWFSIVSLFLPVVSICLWWGTFSGIFPWNGVAIPELLTALTAIVWFWLFLRLVRLNEDFKENKKNW